MKALPNHEMSRVLVLDDEPDILEELEAMLKRAGFDPIVRTDPRQALECLEQDIGIRILVSDIRMPGWDGMDLVRALTKSQGEDRAEIVFMSGYASRDHVQSALRMEAADFLFKPFREQEFILAVRRALRRDLEKRQLREVLSITQGQLSKIESRLRYLHSEKEDIEPESVRGGSRTAADGKLASAGARRILKNAAEARALRGRFFDPELCSGATWNIMVDLMIARLANRPDYVSSLAVGSGIPLTTALRHVEDLVNRGLVRKERDPSDRRRVFLWLTDEAARKMEGFLEACASDSLLEI